MIASKRIFPLFAILNIYLTRDRRKYALYSLQNHGPRDNGRRSAGPGSEESINFLPAKRGQWTNSLI